MNLAALRAAVDRRTGIAQDSSAQIASINEALQVISTERAWHWLDGVDSFTATAGTSAYDLPSGWAGTRSVSIAGFPCRVLNAADGDIFGEFGDVTSTYSVTIEDGQLVIYPEPGAVDVVHRYVIVEPTLASDTDTPVLPARFHSLIVDYAAMLICQRVSDKRAAVFETSYQRGIKRAYGSVRSGQPRRIRVRSGGMM